MSFRDFGTLTNDVIVLMLSSPLKSMSMATTGVMAAAQVHLYNAFALTSCCLNKQLTVSITTVAYISKKGQKRLQPLRKFQSRYRSHLYKNVPFLGSCSLALQKKSLESWFIDHWYVSWRLNLNWTQPQIPWMTPLFFPVKHCVCRFWIALVRELNSNMTWHLPWHAN